MSGRVYFSDLKTGEQFDHPLQGATVCSLGAFIERPKGNRIGKRMSIQIRRGMWFQQTVTTLDFFNMAVMVRYWHPDETQRETFILVDRSLQKMMKR